MEYNNLKVSIPLSERKELNQNCIDSIEGAVPIYNREEIYNYYTGKGGLHGLNYVDYGNYYDYGEAKKVIEQGQFYTSDELCGWIMDCLRPGKHDTIADLTCGKGSFFNHIENQSNAFGCELDPASHQIANHLFPYAHISLGDIRTYETSRKFDFVIGNPPFNLTWKDPNGGKISSQGAYLQIAAKFMYPAGILAIIVPNSFLGEMTPKKVKKSIYKQFNHIAQISLDPNAFHFLGVDNFSTKLLILQRKADVLNDIPYSDDILQMEDSAEVYEKVVKPFKLLKHKYSPHIKLQVNREESLKKVRKRETDLMLYQIKVHPKSSHLHEECAKYIHDYNTQRCPEGMSEAEWERKRTRFKNVRRKLKGVLALQNYVEQDKIELVKGKYHIYYKAFSESLKETAQMLNSQLPYEKINSYITDATDEELESCKQYRKIILKKRKEYRKQTKKWEYMEQDPEIIDWLKKWKLSNKWGNKIIKLNPLQLEDTAIALQKKRTYLQWSQGAGKTVSGVAQGMYLLERGDVEYVFTISTAISIKGTWEPFLKEFGIPHKVIKKKSDFRRVFAGDFVLITLGLVKNFQAYIQKMMKLAKQNIMLIYDEAHNSSAFEENEEVAKLTKATLRCFLRAKCKLLMSGTAILNNVVEFYAQLYLLYNGSIMMRSFAEGIFSYHEKDEDYSEHQNPYFGEPYPPYMEGRNLFRASHLPEKPTVFGVVQNTPDIFNAEALRDIISYTVITRTFKEVTGKDLERLHELPATMTPEEQTLYDSANKGLEYHMKLYFKNYDQMNERKRAQSKIIAQIKIMLKMCTSAHVFPNYTGDGVTGRLQSIFDKVDKLPNKRIAVGVRHNGIVRAYVEQFKKRYPDRQIFTVTGEDMKPENRKLLVDGPLKECENAILICTQQSLSESISIDYIDYCFLAELHWNFSKMSQFYFRFIRYTSENLKHIYICNYPMSIETNLLFLIVAKERMLCFLKGEDIEFDELFERMGLDMALHQSAVVKLYDKDGHPYLGWGKQQIVA